MEIPRIAVDDQQYRHSWVNGRRSPVTGRESVLAAAGRRAVRGHGEVTDLSSAVSVVRSVSMRRRAGLTSMPRVTTR